MALLAAVAVSAAGASGCGSGGKHRAPQARRPPLVSIFEAQSQLLTDPGGTLGQLRRLGVTMVRVFVPWGSIAPDPRSRLEPDGFDAGSPDSYPAAGWRPFDALVRAARVRHVEVYITLEGPAPLWATGRGAPPHSPLGGGDWEPSPSAFANFVRAVGTRYSGHYVPSGASAALPRVSVWSLWNEPNDGPALAPQTIDNSTLETSAISYRHLLDAGWRSLVATGHRADTILIGELAPLGQTLPANVFPGTFGEMVPLRFVRALYCVDANVRPLRGAAAAARDCPPTAAGSRLFAVEHPSLFEATGFAVHPYPGPTRIAPDTVLSSSPDYANLAALPKLEQLLTLVTSEYGHGRRFPLWNTEFGYITDPPWPPGAPLATGLAAAYENWAEFISWQSPWLHTWDHYQLVDPTPAEHSDFFSGLRFSDGTQKPTYDAFRMPIYLPVTAQRGGRGLEVWGCVRPAYYDPQPQPARIQLQPGGRGSFKTIKSVPLTDKSCYFDVAPRFPSGGDVRVAWSYSHGPTVYSRLVAITVS